MITSVEKLPLQVRELSASVHRHAWWHCVCIDRRLSLALEPRVVANEGIKAIVEAKLKVVANQLVDEVLRFLADRCSRNGGPAIRQIIGKSAAKHCFRETSDVLDILFVIATSSVAGRHSTKKRRGSQPSRVTNLSKGHRG